MTNNKNKIFEYVKGIIEPYLKEEGLTIETTSDFVNDLGLESIDMVDIVIQLEDVFVVKIDLKEIDNFKTINDLIHFIEIKTNNFHNI